MTHSPAHRRQRLGSLESHAIKAHAKRDDHDRVTLAHRLVDLNTRWSRATERALRLPTDKALWKRRQQTTEAEIRRLPDGSTIVDLGARRRCIYTGPLLIRRRTSPPSTRRRRAGA